MTIKQACVRPSDCRTGPLISCLDQPLQAPPSAGQSCLEEMKEGEGRLAVENSTWVFRMEVRCHYVQHLVHCVSADRCVITHMWQLCLPGGGVRTVSKQHTWHAGWQTRLVWLSGTCRHSGKGSSLRYRHAKKKTLKMKMKQICVFKDASHFLGGVRTQALTDVLRNISGIRRRRSSIDPAADDKQPVKQLCPDTWVKHLSLPSPFLTA